MFTESKSFFIVFEGIDGSGKSTHSRLLCERLQAENLPMYKTFEPTDSEIGKMIRNIITGQQKTDPRTLAGLFVADRLNHILNDENGMKKILNEGKNIISDRYYFSSYAYHSLDMDMDWVIAANSLSASMLKPTLNIFIDVAPEICMERISKNRLGLDLFETLDKLKAIRENYFRAFEKLKSKEKIVVIDGNRAISHVHEDVCAAAKELY